MWLLSLTRQLIALTAYLCAVNGIYDDVFIMTGISCVCIGGRCLCWKPVSIVVFVLIWHSPGCEWDGFCVIRCLRHINVASKLIFKLARSRWMQQKKGTSVFSLVCVVYGWKFWSWFWACGGGLFMVWWCCDGKPPFEAFGSIRAFSQFEDRTCDF